MKFEEKGWAERDISYLYRDAMLNDLLENHQIKGLHYHQLEDKLGKTDYSNEISYEIRTDYGFGIDPIYIKNLIIILDKDSIATDFKIEEHEH